MFVRTDLSSTNPNQQFNFKSQKNLKNTKTHQKQPQITKNRKEALQPFKPHKILLYLKFKTVLV